MSEMNAQTGERKASPLGEAIVGRINALATISQDPGNLTRIFLTSEHRAAAELIMGWMREAGMNARIPTSTESPPLITAVTSPEIVSFSSKAFCKLDQSFGRSTRISES